MEYYKPTIEQQPVRNSKLEEDMMSMEAKMDRIKKKEANKFKLKNVKKMFTKKFKALYIKRQETIKLFYKLSKYFVSQPCFHKKQMVS